MYSRHSRQNAEPRYQLLAVRRKVAFMPQSICLAVLFHRVRDAISAGGAAVLTTRSGGRSGHEELDAVEGSLPQVESALDAVADSTGTDEPRGCEMVGER
jgi:hypothetical protein